MSERYMVRVYELEQEFYGLFDSPREAQNWVAAQWEDPKGVLAEGDQTEVVVLNLP